VSDPDSTEKPHSHPLRAFLRLLGAGVLVAVPLAVTLWVMVISYHFIDEISAPFYRSLGWNFPGLGFVTTIAITLLLGFMATNMLGRRIIDRIDTFVLAIPLVSAVYGAVKQALESFRSIKDSRNFKRVAYIRYPESSGLLVGFVTGQCYDPALGREYTLIFLPFTPNPVSGRIVAVPNEDVIDSGLTIEQVMKMILSAGLVAPGKPEDVIRAEMTPKI